MAVVDSQSSEKRSKSQQRTKLQGHAFNGWIGIANLNLNGLS